MIVTIDILKLIEDNFKDEIKELNITPMELIDMSVIISEEFNKAGAFRYGIIDDFCVTIARLIRRLPEERKVRC
mgnify:CR=1 FL=1